MMERREKPMVKRKRKTRLVLIAVRGYLKKSNLSVALTAQPEGRNREIFLIKSGTISMGHQHPPRAAKTLASRTDTPMTDSIFFNTEPMNMLRADKEAP